MRQFAIILCAILLPAASAQPPSFTRAGVVPTNTSLQIPLEPGMMVSIWGERLGPVAGCAYSNDGGPHPTNLCNVQVTLDGQAMGLVYVSEKVIYFLMPQDAPTQGTASLQTTYKGEVSAPLSVPLGKSKTTVSLDGPAYVGMPVWIKVDLAFAVGQGAVGSYPFAMGIASFGCNEVLAQKDGALLPRRREFQSTMPRAFAGNICGSWSAPVKGREGRLPLHLQYIFNEPGAYEIRYRMLDHPPGFAGPIREEQPKAESEWTKIEILPSTPRQRETWLEDRRKSAPQDAPSLVTEYLPSLLGTPDDLSLKILIAYLHHPDEMVRRFAADGLLYWPDEAVYPLLLRDVEEHGPTESMIQYFSRYGDVKKSPFAVIQRLSLPYLTSPSPVVLAGAVEALRTCGHDEATLTAMLNAAEHIAKMADSQTVTNFVASFGATKDARVRALLWSFVQRKIAAEQTAIALCWIADRRDLDKMGKLMIDGGQGIAYSLRRSYKADALPYLERAALDSSNPIVRRECAEELANARKEDAPR